MKCEINLKLTTEVSDVVLKPLLLILNRFDTLFWCFSADFFFNCYLATPWPTLGHYRGGSLTHLMLITCILCIRPEGHRGP